MTSLLSWTIVIPPSSRRTKIERQQYDACFARMYWHRLQRRTEQVLFRWTELLNGVDVDMAERSMALGKLVTYRADSARALQA